MLLLPPVWTTGGQTRTQSSPWIDDSRYYVNLNQLESRTWRRILSGVSIAAIAADDGVSRQAVYARIQGDAKGRGGMISKNFWCLLWWRLRQRQTGTRRRTPAR